MFEYAVYSQLNKFPLFTQEINSADQHQVALTYM